VVPAQGLLPFALRAAEWQVRRIWKYLGTGLVQGITYSIVEL
jgi:hypothetical protein